jgi:hypothetical protein
MQSERERERKEETRGGKLRRGRIKKVEKRAEEGKCWEGEDCRHLKKRAPLHHSYRLQVSNTMAALNFFFFFVKKLFYVKINVTI